MMNPAGQNRVENVTLCSPGLSIRGGGFPPPIFLQAFGFLLTFFGCTLLDESYQIFIAHITQMNKI